MIALTPFTHDGSYRGLTATGPHGEVLYDATTGEFLRDLAVCMHALRERGVRVEPQLIELKQKP